MAYRDHLEAAQRMTKRVPQELLEAPECPDELIHLWVWFCQLPLAVTYSEIKAWSELTGHSPNDQEVQTLMQATQVYQKVIYG